MPSTPKSTGERGDGAVAPVPAVERTDLTFALVAGVYASVVLVPPALALAAPALDGPGSRYIALLVGITTVTVAVTLALRRTRAAGERLGAGSRRFLPALVPPAVAVAAVGAVAVLAPSLVDEAAVAGAVTAVGGAGLGGLVAVMADTRYVRAVVDAVAVHASWRAPWPERRRRRVQFVGGGLVVASLPLVVAGVVLEDTLVRVAGQALLPAGVVVGTFGREREYRATAAGLEYRSPGRRHLYPWDSFEGFAVTDRAVVLHPRAPWRLPVYCDRSALDTDEVVAALGRYLPCLPS